MGASARQPAGIGSDLTTMEIGFQFEVIYQDNDLVEVRVSAWNGLFGGSSDVYLNKGELRDLARKLEGFPNSPQDSREFMLGSFDQESAGGGVLMTFHCIDGQGHINVTAKIESSTDVDLRQSVVLSQPLEASAVDTFVAELDELEKNPNRVASLTGMAARH